MPSIPLFNRIRNRIDPRHYNGASMLGLNGSVIKSHGGADQIAFVAAMERAILEVEKNIPELIKARLSM